MKYYKGFNPDMTCRDFKYKEGESYETDTAELCSKGFHACKAPLEVFQHYSPCTESGELNKFHEVELDEISDEQDETTKVVAKKIKIGAELSFLGLAKAHIEWVKSNIKESEKTTNTGDSSAATNTGYKSVAVAWGIEGKAKAAKGSYIVLAEWAKKGEEWELKGAKMAKVDGKKIKADTFYRLINGEFVEVHDGN